MKPELQKYYDDQFSMFASDGWQDLMNHIADMIEATDSISGIKDNDDLHFKKGELSILGWLKGWEESVTVAYENLKNES